MLWVYCSFNWNHTLAIEPHRVASVCWTATKQTIESTVVSQACFNRCCLLIALRCHVSHSIAFNRRLRWRRRRRQHSAGGDKTNGAIDTFRRCATEWPVAINYKLPLFTHFGKLKWMKNVRFWCAMKIFIVRTASECVFGVSDRFGKRHTAYSKQTHKSNCHASHANTITYASQQQ